MTYEPNYDAPLEPSAPTRECSMGHLVPGYIVGYHKVQYPPIFATFEECTKEASGGDTCKIRILCQEESLYAGKYHLTPTKIPSHHPTNYKYVDKDVVVDELIKEDMSKLCSTEDILVRGKRYLLV